MKPSQEYTIKILSDEDFNVLPYDVPRDTMGFSDVRKKVAYVRSTGIKDLDIATLNHEFDELMQGTSLHEIDGIRYKSGGGLGKILGPIVGTIAGVLTGNPAIGMAVGAAISGGTQAHSQAVKPEKYGSGFGGIASAGAMGGIGAYGGSSLINAGRVAATNAAIAGGTGNTAATFGAGVKGALGAAMPEITSKGISSIMSATAPKNEESALLKYEPGDSGFTPSEATQAFYPKETFEGPLSRPDFDTSMANLSRNASLKERGVMDTFRGRSLTGDTAFSKALANTRSSSDLTRQQFLTDQKNLGSTFA